MNRLGDPLRDPAGVVGVAVIVALGRAPFHRLNPGATCGSRARDSSSMTTESAVILVTRAVAPSARRTRSNNSSTWG